MHPRVHADRTPHKPAVIMADSGAVITFSELDQASNRAAHFMRSLDLMQGDVVAVFLENDPRYFELAWAAQRAGLYCVGVSSKLTATELAYIVRDSGAKLLVTAASLAPVVDELPPLLPGVALFMIGEVVAPYRSWEEHTKALPATPIADERAGGDILYSSGTTGRPKGILAPLPEDPDITGPTPLSKIVGAYFGIDAFSVYLTPAPLYHAAPLRWSMAVQKLGGTVVLMEKFDAAAALSLIQRHRITHSQWVPAHFIRMLKLPEDQRKAYDVSSMKLAVHAAAPCPVPVKQAMIDWWGPILVEYYAGTEGNGMTIINSEQWLKKPGSVGRAALGTLHICDDAGEPLPARTNGNVYFESAAVFEYRNDPEKTAGSRNKYGWSTLGDIGWLDEDGFLYLTDRKSFMIISGGVNIYPQEIENLLVLHPKVQDVAVVGAPDPEMGEKVVAVVQPVDWSDATAAFAEELRVWTRSRLSGVKTPRLIEFMAELPRHPTGKLMKRPIRDSYWPAK